MAFLSDRLLGRRSVIRGDLHVLRPEIESVIARFALAAPHSGVSFGRPVCSAPRRDAIHGEGTTIVVPIDVLLSRSIQHFDRLCDVLSAAKSHRRFAAQFRSRVLHYAY